MTRERHANFIPAVFLIGLGSRLASAARRAVSLCLAGQRRLKEARMAKQAIIPHVENHVRPDAFPRHGSSFARPEVVARALGFTEKEKALAREMPERFTWRYSTAHPPEEQDANVRGDEKRAPDDLEAAS
jgi:hypothetical protein